MVKNMPGIFAEVGKLGVQLMGGLLREILDVLNPMNWKQAISDMASGISEGFQDATALQLSENQKKGLTFKNPSSALGGLKLLPKTPAVLPGLHLPPPRWPEPRRERTREVVEHHAPVTVNNYITVNGDKDPRKTADLVGATVAFHFSKQGLHKNLATGSGFGNAQPAAHS
jgi:hypothetical protein